MKRKPIETGSAIVQSWRLPRDVEAGGAPAVVDALLELLDTRGQARYDEAVTQVEHALQAAVLARADGAPDSLVVAALLHDVGHLLEAEGDATVGAVDRDLQHEIAGTRLLRRWFRPVVVGPVALHVRAKRYLVATDPAYGTRLSSASRRSLALQGGPLTAREADAFPRLPHAAGAIAVRRWDDRAKVPDLAVPPLSTFADVLHREIRLPPVPRP